MNEKDRVIIVGAGPVGLICALALGRAGVPTTVLEQRSYLEDDPRAATTHPATLELLARLDIEHEVRNRGLVCPVFQFWDRPTGDLVAEFDHALLENDTDFPYVVQCEQFKTAQIALERIEALSCVDVHFNSTVQSVVDHGDRVSVHTGDREYTGRYVIGADGGRSAVRKSAGFAFEGFTWAEQFVVLTTPFDFGAEKGYCERSYFADPEEWCNCFKVAADGPPGLWRTVFPAPIDKSEDELLSDDSIQAWLQKFFPRTGAYEVAHRNLYRVHQRVADVFRKGSVLLAGDAAHVNNPIGGMGLNGGIQDAMNLADKLIQIWLDGADDTLLDLYDLQRRTVTTEFVQQQTISNKKRLEEKDYQRRNRNLDELRETAADSRLAREFLMRTSMLAAQKRELSITLSGKAETKS